MRHRVSSPPRPLALLMINLLNEAVSFKRMFEF